MQQRRFNWERTLGVGLLLLLVGQSALAQGSSFTNPLGDTTFAGIIQTGIRFLLSLVGLLALAAIVWGGVLYIVSVGNDQYIKQAKTVIFWAVVGLIVVALAYVIIGTVSSFLGL